MAHEVNLSKRGSDEGTVDGQGNTLDTASWITKGTVLAGGHTPDKAPSSQTPPAPAANYPQGDPSR